MPVAPSSEPEALSPPPSEFARWIDSRTISERSLELVADAAECAALARRFMLITVRQLAARITLAREGAAIIAHGRLHAAIVQSCAVSGEDLPVTIDEPFTLRFVPADTTQAGAEEIEISEDECDEIAFTGTRFDLGEAVAQSLALAIDPFATGSAADHVRRAGLLGTQAAGPFAALATLMPQPKPKPPFTPERT